ncbi:MAG: hypothetical protein GY723_14075 [bacterium]|nr:hypothetical protein [bacterium]
MSDARAAHPGLYRIDQNPPSLLGQRCAACGRLAFPPNPYGCEGCGAEADELVTEEIPGDGELAAFATVHLHPGKDIETPFTVGTVVLDAGPTVRATLTCATDDGLAIGNRVHTQLVPQQSEDDGELLELRFAVEKS